MKAPIEALSQMLPEDKIKALGMTPDEVYLRVRYRYCPLMNSNGLCTRQCGDCREVLLSALNPISGRPKDLYAVLTYRLRDRVYKQLVKKSEGEKTLPVGRSVLGIPIEIENPFVELELLYV